MRALLQNSLVAVFSAALLLAACVPAPTATPVAVLPTATPTATPSATPTLAPVPVPTDTPTSAETPTATLEATLRPTSTPTTIPPTPRATPTPTPSNAVTILISSLNVREGPSTLYGVVDVLDRGTSVSAIADNGKSGDEVWYQVELSDGASGWISGNSQYVSVPGDLWNRLGTGKWKTLPTPTPLYFILPGARERYSFDEIVPLLSTPKLVSLFMRNNIAYDGSWDTKVAGGNEYAPARVVYERGVDDCDGHATLQAYLLKANGYEAYSVGISIIGPNPLGHNVAGYRDKDDPSKIWSLNNSGEMIGPFSSWEELAQWYIDNGYAYAGGTIRLFDPLGITQITTDNTHPSVLQLPQTVVRE